MLLERLVLENYGVYEGRSELDLATSPEKPIILVGGTNGAGKTTIFESIMVALYSKTYLGAKTTRASYLAFVADRIHRYKNGRRAKRASVEVSFRFYHNGSDDSYAISREWDVDGASVSETLHIRKNGETMDDVNGSLWQSFIEGLIPIGVARFFFFDGEKIVRVTKWSHGDNAEIRSSMDTLLGTELISRLGADLDLYTVRKSGSESQHRDVRSEYEDLMKEKSRAASDSAALEAEYDRKNAEMEEIMSQISARELKVAGIGGGYADMRSGLLAHKAVLEEKLRHSGREIREELADYAPLYLAPAVLDGIQEQINSDVDIMQKKFSISLMKDRIEDLKKEISSDGFRSDNSMNDAACRRICTRLDNMIKKPARGEFFDMSPDDVEWMRQVIGEAKEGSQPLRDRIEEYKRIGMRLAKTKSDLANVPRDDELGPRISEINGMHQEVGILRSEIASIAQEISSKQAYQKILRTKLKALVDALHRGRTSSAGVELAARMKRALSTYHRNARERKMLELEAHLLNAVRTLLHKGTISKIEVDRDTFELRVYGNNGGEPMPGDLLAMGERQMIGTAMLWAIARTCGRPLPFVIDTPMGRLDMGHRNNLVDRFYPFASHQLVLLSTDAEIGHREHAKLSRYVSRSYHTEYDSGKASTSIRTGYFAEEEIA